MLHVWKNVEKNDIYDMNARKREKNDFTLMYYCLMFCCEFSRRITHRHARLFLRQISECAKFIPEYSWNLTCPHCECSQIHSLCFCKSVLFDGLRSDSTDGMIYFFLVAFVWFLVDLNQLNDPKPRPHMSHIRNDGNQEIET